MVIWYKFCSSTYFSFLFIYSFKHDFFFLSFFLCFCTFIWLQWDLRSNWTNVIFYFFFFDSNLFSVLSIKANHFSSIIIHYLIPFIFFCCCWCNSIYLLFISFIFFMEHIFPKIILKIYFDHIHIMCLYRVFFVHCTDYTLASFNWGM